jgi:hypothetical protein
MYRKFAEQPSQAPDKNMLVVASNGLYMSQEPAYRWCRADLGSLLRGSYVKLNWP